MEKLVYASIPFGLHFQCTSSETPPENPSRNCRERNHAVHFATTVTTSQSSGSNDHPPSEKQLMQVGMGQLTLSQFVAASKRNQLNADLSHTICLQKNENNLLQFMQPSFAPASEVSQFCSYNPSSHNQLRDLINLNAIELRGNKEFARTPLPMRTEKKKIWLASKQPCLLAVLKTKGSPSTKLDTKKEGVSCITKSIKEVAMFDEVFLKPCLNFP
ncbi:hypothetical protein ACFX2G_007052 [Malus domestica]